MTSAALQQLLSKSAPGVKVANDHIVDTNKKVSKYRNKRFTCDEGLKWDSLKEYKRYKELKVMERLGLVAGIQRQVVYQLSVCKYIADFLYVDCHGKIIVEDVKSKHTRKLPVYRLKKKMMKSELGIDIKEV